MTFISYSQNYEDVMLWRALKHVDKGFYIDVGANDPVIESVTKAFYDHGWTGINIEPLPVHHAALEKDRVRDINLCCAAGATNGEIDIWVCDIRGWATAVDDVVAQHEHEGHAGEYLRVPVRTLAEICDQHANGEIHFLKIDVEGFEAAVLKGMDFSRFRPWIVVVEGTKPNSSEQVYSKWEGSLLAEGYCFSYADGLNRFYVAGEHAELCAALQYPPNVFDDFILQAQVEAVAAAKHNGEVARQAQVLAQHFEVVFRQTEARAQQAEARAQQAEAGAQQAEASAQQAEARAQQAEANAQQAEARAQQAEASAQQAGMALNAVYASSSWRLTAPLRFIGRMGRNVPQRLASIKSEIKLLLMHARLYIARRPWLSRAVQAALKGFPALERRLKQATAKPSALNGQPDMVAELGSRPVRARRIYAELKTGVENHKKEGR